MMKRKRSTSAGTAYSSDPVPGEIFPVRVCLPKNEHGSTGQRADVNLAYATPLPRMGSVGKNLCWG